MAALAAGLVVAYVAYKIVYRYTPTSEAKAAPIDITKISLTIVAGVGGVVALVIAYRRQRDAEQGRFVERFGAAAAQLGSTDVAVRIAGVYAMAGAADETDGRRRQQCIDVLCGYLRLPYDPELGSNHQSKLVVKRRRTVRDRSQVGAEQEQHLEYRQNDREVRATIVRVIADHLRPKAEYSWSTSDFDFRTAHLEDTDFSNTTFTGACRFEQATFSGPTAFWNVTFSSDAAFGGATFSGPAGFWNATFSGPAGFGGATFSGPARFGDATFSGPTRFERAAFSSDAGFGDATFSSDAAFARATFSGPASFRGAAFSSPARFRGATFSGPTAFWNVTFSSDAVFERAAFSSSAGFWNATFSGPTTFRGAKFSGPTRFQGATFAGPCSFAHADFGAEPISFAGPKQWGPPAPAFDWNQNPAHKPANVKPHDWPPSVATPPTPAA